MKEIFHESSSVLLISESPYPRLYEQFEMPFNSVKIEKINTNTTNHLCRISKFSIGKVDKPRNLLIFFGDLSICPINLKEVFWSSKALSRYLKNEYHTGTNNDKKTRSFLIAETLQRLFNSESFRRKDRKLGDNRVMDLYHLKNFKDFRSFVYDVCLEGNSQNKKIMKEMIKCPLARKNTGPFIASSFRASHSKNDYSLSEASLLIGRLSSSNLNLCFRVSRDSRKPINSPEVLVGNRGLEFKLGLGSKFITIKRREGKLPVISIKFKFIV
jgi:hypothetical protein